MSDAIRPEDLEKGTLVEMKMANGEYRLSRVTAVVKRKTKFEPYGHVKIDVLRPGGGVECSDEVGFKELNKYLRWLPVVEASHKPSPFRGYGMLFSEFAEEVEELRREAYIARDTKQIMFYDVLINHMERAVDVVNRRVMTRPDVAYAPSKNAVIRTRATEHDR